MSFRWPEALTLTFVSKYIEHECLWNLKSPSYKSKQAREAAYFDIQNTMNLPGFGEQEIKMKIKNIRSTYSQELKKIRYSKNGPDTYIPTLKWFSMLDSALQITAPIQIKSDFYSYNSNTDGDDTDSEQNSNAMEKCLEFQEDPLLRPTKIKKLDQLPNMVTRGAADYNTTPDENEFDIFGKHVSVQLKSLPLLLAIEAQEHIQLYLNRIRRQHLQNA